MSEQAPRRCGVIQRRSCPGKSREALEDTPRVVQLPAYGQALLEACCRLAGLTPAHVNVSGFKGGSFKISNPSMAWNGSLYLVVSEETTTGQGLAPGMIYGKRVLLDGTINDYTPITIMAGNNPDAAAMGNVFLVVDTHEPINHNRIPKAARVDGNTGAVLGSPVAIGTPYATHAHVAVLGSRWFVTWQHNPTHGNPYSSISACFATADGASTSELSVVGATSRTPDLDSSGNQAFIAYFNGGEVRGKRMLPDGTLLDGGTGRRIYPSRAVPIHW